MAALHKTMKSLAILFSVIFAGLLLPEIVGRHGLVPAAGYTILGVAVIWIAYFGLGSLFRFIYEQGVREETLQDRDRH